MNGVATNTQGSKFPHASASPKKLLCLYAQEDVRFFRELQSHLYIWVRSQKITWLEIGAGDTVGEAMKSHLLQADLILLLDSADFIRDDSLYQWMQIALEEQAKRQVPVIPILARPAAWEETPYGGLKVLPDNQQPISRWPDRDEAYQQIFKSLALLPELQTSKRTTPASSPIHPINGPSVSTFQARDLSSEYVARPEIVARIKQSLLQAGSVQTTAITTALHGAGGFGKTTLALALYHDPEVRAAFPDGVFWIELGEQPPGTLDLFNRLLPALGDTATEAGTMEEAQARWQEALANKTCLLIIDDVWQAAALKPLLEGGPRCRRLVTTRHDGVLPQNAQRVIVDAMSKPEAIAVLTQGLSIDLRQASTQALLAELVEHLGCWPLLLGVARGLLATQLRYGRPLPQALEEIRQTYQGKRGVTISTTATTGFQETVDTSLKASFRQLEEVIIAHYQPVKRYEELAIFPEDVDIPIALLSLFWQATGGLELWETDDLCMQLAGLSLVLNCDLEAGTIRLHDVTRDYLIKQAGPRLPQWQAQFLDAIRQGFGIQRWAQVTPANAYLWQHLIWHLCHAQRWEELQTVLTDLGYLARKALYQGISALEADLWLASTASSEQSQEAASAFASALHQRITRLSHLLRQAQTPSEVGSVLLSHLRTDPRFAGQRHLLEDELPRPFLAAWHPLPETSSSSLVRTLTGHAFSVLGCAISPDGRFIVSASDDKTLKLWDASSGAQRLTLTGHSDRVNGCAISPDGRFIVSASDDRTLKIWDAASSAERLTLAGHVTSVRGCAISPDGRFIVSASDDKTLKIWDASSGALRLTLAGHASSVNGCAISPDGRFIVSASDDKTLKLWDAASGAERLTLAGHASSVYGCAISSDGRFIVSASTDNTLKIWDASSGAERLTLAGHSNSVNGCAISPDGHFIVSASDDNTLKLWETRSGRCLLTFPIDGQLFGCTFHPDGKRLVACGDQGIFFLRLVQ